MPSRSAVSRETGTISETISIESTNGDAAIPHILPRRPSDRRRNRTYLPSASDPNRSGRLRTCARSAVSAAGVIPSIRAA